MGGNRPPQRRDSERIGVADRLADERPPGCLEDGFGRRSSRLANFEVNDFGAGGLPLVGGAEHIHGDEGRDEATAGGTQAHATSCVRRLRMASGFRYEERPFLAQW